MMNRYKQNYFCEPIYTMTGRLVAMEMLTSFTTPDGKTCSYSEMADILIPEYKWLNFVRQLYCIRRWCSWFIKQEIYLSLNLDADTAVWLLRDKSVLSLLAKMPFIRLEVHEHFPSSEKEKQGLLNHLRPHVALWLDDVGSGSRNNFALLISGFFCGTKIDKTFFWEHHINDISKLSKVIRDLTRYTGLVVVEGIENPTHLMSLSANPHCWLQGYLFPHISIERIWDVPMQIRLLPSLDDSCSAEVSPDSTGINQAESANDFSDMQRSRKCIL
ncbi:hypothetical protein C3433_16490 [Citrobacter freundii]|nr:hypothetical protein C3433_16490 [Citrobacter freundii]